jgi:Ni/Co efflux regulator RcnB
MKKTILTLLVAALTLGASQAQNGQKAERQAKKEVRKAERASAKQSRQSERTVKKQQRKTQRATDKANKPKTGNGFDQPGAPIGTGTGS